MKSFIFPFVLLLTIQGTVVIPQQLPDYRSKDTLQATTRPLTIDWKDQGKPLRPMWAYYGYDEPNYTYMKDGKKLLSEIAALSPVPVYVRCHNLLTTGDGQPALKWGSTNAYTEDAKGRPVYDWHIVDSIFDTYIQRGMKPLAEIGFMPEALSTHPHPYRHYWKPGVQYDSVYTGWAYPSNDDKEWGELIFQWVRHCMARYGEKEVSTWLWEVWNEPNIGYWKGSQEDYFRIYDYAADAVKRALPSARVGGPATTGPRSERAAVWLQHFLVHCAEGKNYVTGGKGSPLDFISFHAKGSPKIVEGHVRMNRSPELGDVAKGFEVVNASAFKGLPLFITECDPEGCAACGMATNPENAYRNGTMYSSYTAASFARIYDLAERYDVDLEGAMSWAFEFEGQKWFDGFRDLATNGVDKPVLNVFRMYGLMRGNRVKVENPGEMPLDSILKGVVRGDDPDIHALATIDKNTAAVMIWNYQDDDLPGDPAGITLTLTHVPGTALLLQHYSIDDEHSNAYTAWKKMGSPQSVTDQQYAELEKAGKLELAEPLRSVSVSEGKAIVRFDLPRHGVSLLRLSLTH
jgi:xylan 1,4-beta-xylosidase